MNALTVFITVTDTSTWRRCPNRLSLVLEQKHTMATDDISGQNPERKLQLLDSKCCKRLNSLFWTPLYRDTCISVSLFIL